MMMQSRKHFSESESAETAQGQIVQEPTDAETTRHPFSLTSKPGFFWHIIIYGGKNSTSAVPYCDFVYIFL
jgi:hypothetical protein